MDMSEFVGQLPVRPSKKFVKTALNGDLYYGVIASPLLLTALPDSARVTCRRRQNVLRQRLPRGCLWQFSKSVKEDTSPPSSFSHHLSSSPTAVAVAPTDVKDRNIALLAVPRCVVIFRRASSQIVEKIPFPVTCLYYKNRLMY